MPKRKRALIIYTLVYLMHSHHGNGITGATVNRS